ncbi:unnamed protein product [Parnassius apollo]|uniref:(apollo) hypothetical protein n=1 Tax=Parnassius apollo TaxID=110799 RepID=A0A8S3Y5N3_PARAO|nr:unnamed protein product [Parnassius apollo]
MEVLWFLFVIPAAGKALELTNEQYHQMPQLFQLDDYEKCLANRRGAFCLGSFDLVAPPNNRFFNVIQKFSEEPYSFNHTRIHRGYCVSARCSDIDEVSLNKKFVKCVKNITQTHYGFDAKLSSLDYCKTSKTPPSRPIDGLDIAFICFCGIILLMNVIGTIYDFARNPDHKPNRYLITWSLAESWKRLTNPYENGDPRLTSLNPINGMKAITLIFVMMAHSIIVYHISYLQNPQFLENASRHPLSTLLHNGSIIVQTFIMLSSFLLAYNLLISGEKDPKNGLNLRLLPRALFNRVVRITPLNVFMVGLTATWWRHMSDGPLWIPLVEAECQHCRDKWWSQFLYINNFIEPDKKCLIQTWFLAVDMQLYVLACFLALTLGRSPRKAVKVLSFLLVCAIVANFVIAYNWNLKAILFITYPEMLRHQYAGVPSFNLLYMAPWGSLPSSLIGLIAAFLLYYWQQVNFKPEESLIFRILYRCSVPSVFIWILSGYFVKKISSPIVIAAYAALDRPVFCLIIVVAMFGFINKVDSLWWQFLSWDGWRPLSRMSLPILLVHWSYSLTQIAVKTNLARSSVFEMSGHWFLTIFMTYVTSLPLHLLIELPMMQFFRALFS